jgi:ankyrin repeat protein
MELYRAVGRNNEKEVERLLAIEGIDVNYICETELNWTPLHMCCINGNFDILKMLLKHKDIKINVVDFLGQTPFYFLCGIGDPEITRYLLYNHNSLNVNLGDQSDCTPLMGACFAGHSQLVDVLIKCYRVDLLAKMGNDLCHYGSVLKAGYTALDVAKTQNRTNILRSLEEELENRKQSK